VLDELVDAGKGTTANRVLATISKLFNWSLGRGYLESSPALGVKPPAKEIARDRVLTLDEVRAIWTAAGTLGYPFGRWTQMMFVTGGSVPAMYPGCCGGIFVGPGGSSRGGSRQAAMCRGRVKTHGAKTKLA
jgi:hypothetical protein